ncbi:hypothetical protein [Sporisorium scitamineum]|uniref:Uncharacterized protein n=1 Tax=Sporisorium scitamineum TaxID=49012 RepID=A0A0F7RUL1_9BASI|nr:hypothetical protein [Sporisorium scitamineum]
MIGASITKGPELEKYLRTKVEHAPQADAEDETPLSQPNSDDEGPHPSAQ